MPIDSVASGVPTLQISQPDPTGTLTTLASATTTVAEVSVAPRKRSGRPAIPSGAVIKAFITWMGYDPNGGYAMNASTATPGSATTTSAANKGLLLRAASPIPANGANAICAAIWLQIGSANPQLCDFAIINPKLDFSFTVSSLPTPGAPYTTVAKLTGATPDPLLGSSRTPYQSLLTPPYTTTGGVNLRHRTEKYTATPDQALNYPVRLGQATDVITRILNPSMSDAVATLGGDELSYIDTDTATTPIDQYAHDIFTSQPDQTGNQAILITYASDTAQRILRRLFLGQVGTTTDDTEENYKKDAQTELQLSLTAAAQDRLLKGMPTAIARRDSI